MNSKFEETNALLRAMLKLQKDWGRWTCSLCCWCLLPELNPLLGYQTLCCDLFRISCTVWWNLCVIELIWICFMLEHVWCIRTCVMDPGTCVMYWCVYLIMDLNLWDGCCDEIVDDGVYAVMRLLIISVWYWSYIYGSSLNERVVIEWSRTALGSMTQQCRHKMSMIIYDGIVSSQNVSQEVFQPGS